MRDQGRLVEWFDEKGYGFIQPNDSSKDRVFLHIKAFTQQGPRPIMGCALEYQVTVDGQGRFQAQQVRYLKAAQVQKNTAKKPTQVQGKTQLQPIQIAIVIYILVLALCTFFGVLNSLFLLFIVLMNVLSYWLYARDKDAALQGKSRVAEQTLHIFSIMGGWPAAWLAQQRLRHKTQKQPFKQIYFCTIGLNVLLLLWLVFSSNVVHI